MISTFFKVSRRFIAAVLVSAVSLDVAFANAPTPRLKPLAPNTSNHLVQTDAKLFRGALRSISNSHWSSASRAIDQIGDPAAKDTLRWLMAARNPNASFNDMTYVVHTLSDWPRMTALQSKAENMIYDGRLSSSAILTWFSGREPVSGEGRAALARAHYQAGNTSEGDRWLRKAWREAKLTRDRQKSIYKAYKNRLRPEDHAARADHLIWEGRSHFSKAQGLLSLMPSDQRALMDARMRIAGNRSGMDAAINRVPAHLQRDPGLLYERARWRRRKKTKEYALATYLDITTPPYSETGKKRVWREKKLMAYWAIQEKRYDVAYRLTQHHGMTSGAGFAEAEFLGGWMALTQLNNPSLAATHFDHLRNGVSTPVSLSRGSYWLGRAHEAMNSVEKHAHYADAARFSNTFYGFLAGERLGGSNMVISLPYEQDPTYLLAAFESDPRVKAMHLLGEAGEERYFTQFAFHLDDVLESPEHLTLLSGLAKQYGYMKPSIRAAKQASRFQGMLTESGYPMPNAIMALPSKFDKAFVLAIARQESEFNYKAVSHASAYGLMQMINATARSTARKHRIPYNRSRMTTDIGYSANLGALHLHDLLNDYDGSYIMAAVAYNAGPRRVKQWNAAYGDPRKGQIDAIDWLESIPFSETRNYVQRVMENMQVYRARMNGNTATNNVYRDITTGAF